MATRNMSGTIQVRRDIASNWESKNPTLLAGEIGYDTTNGITKMGDGASTWLVLPVLATQVLVQGEAQKQISFDSDPQEQLSGVYSAKNPPPGYVLADAIDVISMSGASGALAYSAVDDIIVQAIVGGNNGLTDFVSKHANNPESMVFSNQNGAGYWMFELLFFGTGNLEYSVIPIRGTNWYGSINIYTKQG